VTHHLWPKVYHCESCGGKSNSLIHCLPNPKGQYAFGLDLKVTVVASEAHENGPKPVQTDLDTLAKDIERATAWGFDAELPNDVTDDRPA